VAPFNDSAVNVMLDALDESATQITHVGILTLGTDPGTGTNHAGVEASGGSPAYARQAVTWGPAAGRLKTNTNALTFDVPAGTYGYLAWFNASTGNAGNYRGYAPFGGATPLRGVGTVDTVLANDTILSPVHGLVNNDRVILFNVFGTALPTGLTEGVAYHVVNATADSFKVALTSGGAAVDITAVGGGELYWERIVPEVFGSQGQITVAIGQLSLDGTGV
jgi:hypothetical protein